VKKEKAAT